jgi:hypothetical protein
VKIVKIDHLIEMAFVSRKSNVKICDFRKARTRNVWFKEILCIKRKCSNVVGLRAHAKGRAHKGGMGIGREPKT